MPCDKGQLVVDEKPYNQNWSKRVAKFPKGVLKGKAFGFAQIDIEVPDELYDKFSEMAPLLAQEIPDCKIPEEMHKDKTGRKAIK